MTVAAGLIFSEPYKIIKHLIDDNKVILSGSYPTFPDSNPVYPLCTVEINNEQTGKSFGNKRRELTFTAEIGCYSKSRKQMDEIFNEIDFIISRNTNSLGQSGLKWVGNDSSPSDLENINDTKVHNKVLVSTFKWIGDI